MERSAWTDERLDDLAQRMDAGFERVGRGHPRPEGRERARFGELCGEIRGEIGGVRGEIDALRVTLLRVGGGMMVGLVGVIAAVLASA